MASPEQIQDDGEEIFSHAIQLSMSSLLPMSLYAAVELGVFEIIANAGPNAWLSSSDIAAQLTTRNPQSADMLDRILRLLVSHSVLNCSQATDFNGDSRRVYSLAPVAKFFVRDEDGVALGPYQALVQSSLFLESWSQMKNAILEGGIPFNKVHGCHSYEYPAKDENFNAVFNSAMFNHTTIVMKKVLQSYDGFHGLDKLVDVGGGIGTTLSVITSKYPSVRGVNFDLPHVIARAPQLPGVEHVGGDMFESVPRGDAIILKWILHNWSDDHCLKLLKNCFAVLPDAGNVIVLEAVVPSMPELTASYRSTCAMDVQMMTQFMGGKERTREEFTALATGAGFAGVRFRCFVANFWIMEFFKCATFADFSFIMEGLNKKQPALSHSVFTSKKRDLSLWY